MEETNNNKIALSLDSVHAISKGMPGGFFIYRADESEEILAFNDIVVGIFGCSSDEDFIEYTGGSFSGMVFKKDLVQVEKTIEVQVAGDAHKFDHVEYRILKKNGDIAWVDDFGRLVDTAEFGLVYYVFIQDITEKKKIQEENIRMQVELDKEKNLAQTRDEFLFNVSHDIRTPMNAIMGYTELALSHLDDRNELLDDLDNVKRASGHMMSLIDDLLEMSRLSSEHIELKPEVSCIETELESVIDMQKLTALDKGVELVTRLDIPPAKVIMDAQRFRRVMNNLIENAIKFTPKGGKVTVEALASEASASGYVSYAFKVSDTGIGMSKEFMEKLFLPFSREETSTKSGAWGTGLGLSIAKNLVDRMGGTIEVDSTKNQGSTFTVSIPMKQTKGDSPDTPSKAPVSSVSEAKAAENYRILLVDDMEINRKMAIKILSKAGFRVDAVKDGFDAVKRFNNTKDGFYDLVLMDIQMPVMDGYEATKQIRGMGRDESKKIPILALSANASEEDRKKSLESGMNAHIAKPFDIPALIRTVNEEIKKYRT